LLESLVDKITPWFLDWGLLIVFAATFLESSIVVASILPGESVLLLAGFFSSPGRPIGTSETSLSLPAVITVAFCGAVLGDMVGYAIGRVGGRSIIHRFGRFFFLPEKRMPVLERYFARYGRRAILFARFAPFLRSVRTLVAGTARMPFNRFLLPDLAGAAIWTTGIASAGFLLGESWRVANRYLGAFGAVVFLLLGVGFLFSWRGVRKLVERELSEAPAAAPAGEAGAAPEAGAALETPIAEGQDPDPTA
jgi:membrane protein DedA with SNARE-associated domain